MQQSKEQAALRHRATKARKRAEIIASLGSVCVKCGYSDVRALQIDHVNCDGYLDRHRSGGSYYSYLLKQIQIRPDDFQLLCANCHVIKTATEQAARRKYHGEYVPKQLRPCGTHSAYRRGCRCENCKVAHREYVRVQQKKATANQQP